MTKKNRGEIECFGSVSNSYSTSATRSAEFRSNETLCLLSYEAPYLGPEGGRPGNPTQAVGHTCSGNIGIVKILRWIFDSHISKNPS
jgi:hypothetical protein